MMLRSTVLATNSVLHANPSNFLHFHQLHRIGQSGFSILHVQNEKYLRLYFGQNQSPGIKLRNFAIPDILLAKPGAVTLHLGRAKSSAFGRFATE